MKSSIFIAGCGGIGIASAMILADSSIIDRPIILGDISEHSLDLAIRQIKSSLSKEINVSSVVMPPSGSDETLNEILKTSAIIMDCLPGGQAPRMARLAKENGCHYTNLTEYVAETKEIMEISKDADTGFVLQTGLAPGFINILAHRLYQEFCTEHGVDIVDSVCMKVGAISKHVMAPHFYAFTWSPIGVATEYIKNAEAVRNFEKQIIPALSQTETIIIDGEQYEDDFTSGGAADLPEALAGKVCNLDYKTIRYPGHYSWVKTFVDQNRSQNDIIEKLESYMLENIPSVEDDVVIIYASVSGKDQFGRLRKKERSYKIEPSMIGSHKLRAIQTTTAAPMCEVANMLLSGKYKGTVLQSHLDTLEFLNGPFVSAIYGKY
jgi:saccharopine dehydrogenase-like NADP-dependent oxidoreductase